MKPNLIIGTVAAFALAAPAGARGQFGTAMTGP